MAVSGSDHRRYGGSTTCFYAEVEPDHHLVIDAGTGLRHLQHRVARRTTPQRFTILLTHFHWDHIQGLPVFGPLFTAGTRIDLWAPALGGRSPKESLDAVMCRPWWPIGLDEADAEVRVRAIDDGLDVGGVEVTHAELHHPDGVAGYRLGGNRTIVIATDHEAGDPEADERLVKLAHRADVLFHDAQYTPKERRAGKAGWGHSDWEGAARAARDAGVGRLVLTSHDPDRDDDAIDAIRGAGRSLFPVCDAAHEGMKVAL